MCDSKNPFLSIIIPVYNGGGTINRCLESIWSQGLDEALYEVICVNDCSTDETEAIIHRQQTEHTNLKLFTNAENLRAGGSRNRGVREAKGEYILFIDADDYFHLGSVKQMMEYQMVKRLDILMYDFAREVEGCRSECLVHRFSDTSIMTGYRFFMVNSLPYAPWKFMFKRSLMVNNGIFFEERVSCEDVDWCHRIAFAAEMMKYEPVLLTHYVINEYGQTGTTISSIGAIGDLLFAGYRLMSLSDRYRDKTAVQNCLKNVAAWYYSQGMKYFFAASASLNEKIFILKRFSRSDVSVSSWMRKAWGSPVFFAVITNLSAPVVRMLILLKRKFVKR